MWTSIRLLGAHEASARSPVVLGSSMYRWNEIRPTLLTGLGRTSEDRHAPCRGSRACEEGSTALDATETMKRTERRHLEA